MFALTKLLDSYVNTALLLVFHSGLTVLETSWALLTIAAWLSLLPSSAWLKLYPRVFGQANPNLRSYLIDWPRCSLIGQPQLQFLSTLLMEPDSLDGVNWILAHPIGAEVLEVFKAISPEGHRISLTTLSPNMKLSIQYQVSEAVSRRTPYLINLITKSYYEKAKYLS